MVLPVHKKYRFSRRLIATELQFFATERKPATGLWSEIREATGKPLTSAVNPSASIGNVNTVSDNKFLSEGRREEEVGVRGPRGEEGRAVG